MPAAVLDWQRCGNTPYYMAGNGINWFFIDPFNYRIITTSAEKQGILRGTHEWAYNMVQMKKLFRRDPVTAAIKKTFDVMSPGEKDAVLRGVRALVEGFAVEDLKHIHAKEQVRSRLVISIDAGNGISPADIRAVESHFTDLSNTVLANNTEEALEAVLAEFDIFEC